MKKILIMGLPGSGKTFLGERLAVALNAVYFNADRVRATINNSLGFTVEDRIEHARRMGWMAQLVADSGHFAVSDFVCPTPEARKAFNPDYVIFMNTIKEGRYEDTNKLFVPPEHADLTINDFEYEIEATIEAICNQLKWRSIPSGVDVYDQKNPTAFLLGRYQPFHEGHYQLAMEAHRRVGQICIAVRSTTGLEKNPFSYEDVKKRIIEYFDERGTWDAFSMKVISVPNITNIFYGRDVGYSIEKLELDAALQDVSATKIRASMGL